ncbi:SH3 domain-containing protein [uncultured Lentibacter sp.]|uniref:SH3 domain-containing protein n=1 Tax=uncultured Lentibacter sp. TaxID=1659309 RepID=UPI002619BB36|nr:SH3 domain-containing protein [uncultured Lentibacter sp.]
MIRRLAVVVLACATAANAQELPALYDVYDVGTEDVLNLRAEPKSTSAILGALPPDATGVEVVEARDGWGLLNTGERSGWASMRYLAAASVQPPHGYPARCFGTEPFWQLRNAADMTLDLAEGAPLRFEPVDRGTALGYSGKFFATARTRGEAAEAGLSAVITRAQCNDGMSDRVFGLSVDLLLTSDGVTTLLTGCCTLRSQPASSH